MTVTEVGLAGGTTTTTLTSPIAGTYGSLSIASNGAYTYTPTTDNTRLGSSQTAVERFDYTMQDGSGQTSSSSLYITVYGAGSSDPVAAADTGSATEAGTGAAVNASGNEYCNPFGGYKQSGNGRENGKFGFEEFLEFKAIQFKPTQA